MDGFPDQYKGLSFHQFLVQRYGEEDASSVIASQQLSDVYQAYQSVSFYDLASNEGGVKTDFLLPEKTATCAHAIVIDQLSDGFQVGFVNPFDERAIAQVESVLNNRIEAVMVNASVLYRLHRVMYRKVSMVQSYADHIQSDHVASVTHELVDAGEQHTIPGLVHLIIQDAYEVNASDIHLEKEKSGLKVRVRVDGTLNEYVIKNDSISDNVIRYLKLLSDVDVTQDRLPADGKKVTLLLGGKEANLRFSFMPTYYGQSVVIRLLGDASTYLLRDKIHDSEYLEEIQAYLNRTYGMFVISGPTGSGKTTTLYSSLALINDDHRKIITLEDPVEARIPGLNQVQINEAAGYGFSEAVRASLRQDPDVIMVGEIRDEDTAMMAVRAAITGHLVLASIHTRGVVEIPIRLINLGLDPYLLSSALRLNVSQRLVKLICTNCKVVDPLRSDQKDVVHKMFGQHENDDGVFYRGEGCHLCQSTGFEGRVAVFEILHLTAEMIEQLSRGNIANYMALAADAIQGKTLLDRAFALAKSGRICIDEVLKLEVD